MSDRSSMADESGLRESDLSHSIVHVKYDLAAMKKDLSLDSFAQNSMDEVSLRAVNFSYGYNQSFTSLKSFFEKYYDVFKYLPYNFLLRRIRTKYARLGNVIFTASPNRVTAFIGPNESEIDTLFDTMGGRRKYGTYNGDIFLTGLKPNVQYIESIAYCRETIMQYSPGLTYRNTLKYCALMLLPGKSREFIDKRVDCLLKIMGLSYCKNRVIPENHAVTGEAGRDLRLLSIACEIVALPPVIIVKNPALNLHISLATTIYEALNLLSRLGHIVICSIPKPNMMISRYFDDIVVLSQGYSIYCAPREKLLDYFCSKEVGYTKQQGVDTYDFILDIARGVERPEGKRSVDSPDQQQTNFYNSDFNMNRSIADSKDVPRTSLFASNLFSCFGITSEFAHSPSRLFNTFTTVLERSISIKFKDFDALKRHFSSSVLLAIIIGYLQYNHGKYGYYLQNFFTVPLANTTNISALSFFVTIFSFVQQGLNMHVLCQKLSLFRHEQKSHSCTTISFVLATYIVEVIFAIVFAWFFATIIYFMADLGKGYYNYFFFVNIICHMAVVGNLTAMVYASTLQKEILARDLFLFTVFFMILLSGFPFQLSQMHDHMEKVSYGNPARWGFQGIVLWKFQLGYHNSDLYLAPFGFKTDNHEESILNLDKFIIALSLLFYAVNLPGPMLLSRSEKLAEVSSSKTALINDDNSSSKSVKKNQPVLPVIFARESSVANDMMRRQSFVFQGGKENNSAMGPVVSFNELSYCVTDPDAPDGTKIILNKVSGQFGFGKLSLITGSFGSGKTSLLHILAGNYKPIDDISGEIYYNNSILNQSIPLWKRCALVEANDEIHRDLTVFDVFWYAIKLRTSESLTDQEITAKINEMAETLHLKDQLQDRIKLLKPGARRRVAIGEELFNGSNLLFIDEPTAMLEPYEESVVMTVLRELVNSDKTVIASIQYPHASIYSLFDVAVVLSKGRVIYQGNTNDVTDFFTNSTFKYNFSSYSSPGEFIVDIAGGFIKDSNGEIAESSNLERYYKSSKKYDNIVNRLIDIKSKSQSIDGTGNPLLTSGGSKINAFDVGASSDVDSRVSIVVRNRSFHERQLLQKFIAYNIVPFFTWKDGDMGHMLKQSWNLIVREVYSIYNRKTLLVGSSIVSLLLAAAFGIVMGDSSDQDHFYNAVSFYAVSCLVLLLSGVQFISYIYRRDLIFLKEHSRGLYSNFTYWISVGWPIYILRVINVCCFALLSYGIIKVSDIGSAKFSYFVGMCIAAITAGTILVEVVVHLSRAIRSCYFVIPGLIFVQFAFSGLFVKSSTLPHWLSSWITSVSIIRWSFQGNFINQFKDASWLQPLYTSNSTTEPLYDPYAGFLQLFGWGGKTKGYCAGMLVIFIFVLKITQFFVSGIDTVGRRCGRESKTAMVE